MNLNNYN